MIAEIAVYKTRTGDYAARIDYKGKLYYTNPKPAAKQACCAAGLIIRDLERDENAGCETGQTSGHE